MTLIPRLQGTATIRSAGAEFLEAFRRRVAAGLLTGHPHPRARYVVAESSARHLSVRAAGWWTAINVGLNELELRLGDAGIVHYRVRFWRWALYAIALAGTLGIIGLALILAFDLRSYIARHPASMIPGLSIDQNLSIAWAMVVFWGFAWPWILIAAHKRPVRHLVERLIAEADVQAGH